MAYQQTTVYKRFEHKLCDNSLGASTCSSDKPVAVQSFMAIIYLLSLQTRKILRTFLVNDSFSNENLQLHCRLSLTIELLNSNSLY